MELPRFSILTCDFRNREPEHFHIPAPARKLLTEMWKEKRDISSKYTRDVSCTQSNHSKEIAKKIGRFNLNPILTERN